MHTVPLRPYRESDEEQVIALWQECRLTRPWNDSRKDIARKLQVQRELFLVGYAQDESVPLGKRLIPDH